MTWAVAAVALAAAFQAAPLLVTRAYAQQAPPSQCEVTCNSGSCKAVGNCTCTCTWLGIAKCTCNDQEN
ncbi:MAG TPA: hypothetical protein VFQ45_12260 [Longimicrobium sp.]|nr:hypothetical protein [Longimicrobium sp.]